MVNDDEDIIYMMTTNPTISSSFIRLYIHSFIHSSAC